MVTGTINIVSNYLVAIFYVAIVIYMKYFKGTCINNTAVMMFKKGSFELPTTVYPVAIKVNNY